MDDALLKLLGVYVLATTVVAIVAVVVTLILLKRDKYFALAVTFSEIAIFVAATTFGQSPLSGAVLAIGGLEASIDIQRADDLPHGISVIVIGMCLCASLGMMALRVWDKTTSKR
jgi:hypothetical protein